VNNLRNNITGLLLYGDGIFIQLLEGEESVVQETFEKLSADRLHKGITELARGALKKRNFPEWAMGFKSLNPDSLAEFRGYYSDSKKIALTNDDAHLATTLLNAFIRTSKIYI